LQHLYLLPHSLPRHRFANAAKGIDHRQHGEPQAAAGTPVTETEQTPLPDPSQDETPEEEAPRHHAVQDAVTAIADVALAPMEEVLGHAIWLRWALVCHLLATLTATIVALHENFDDWQIYAWTGLLTAVLIGNFLRWGPSAGWIHRAWTTAAALIVDAVWLLLLFDRARAGQWHRVPHVRGVLSADSSSWFWIPVALLLLCAGFLFAHGLLSPHFRLKRIHHSRQARSQTQA
jgi:hypothetical protein